MNKIIAAYDWSSFHFGLCWCCQTPKHKDPLYGDEWFTAYASLRDWTQVPLCSPACIREAFHYEHAPLFDWHQVKRGDRVWCATCHHKAKRVYLTLTSEDEHEWQFCSCACVRRYFVDPEPSSNIFPWERLEEAEERYGHYDDPPLRTRDRRYCR